MKTDEFNSILSAIWSHTRPEVAVSIFRELGLSFTKNSLGKRANNLGVKFVAENALIAKNNLSKLKTSNPEMSNSVEVAMRFIESEKTVSDYEKKDELKFLRSRVSDMERDRFLDKKKMEIFDCLYSHEPVIDPAWTKIPMCKGFHHGIPILLLSDMHYGEVVYPDMIRGANEYNCDIAAKRLRNTIIGAIKMCKHYKTNIKYDGIILLVAGDMVTGYIHEELRRSADIKIFPAMYALLDLLHNAICMLREEFKNVSVKWVVGNHGRLDPKKQHKSCVEDNYEWILGKFLADKFKGDESISFEVSKSPDLIFRVYGSAGLVTHGDNIQGGNAMTGVEPAILRGIIRIIKQYRSLGRDYWFDSIFAGHHHNRMLLKDNYFNGSLIGYTEYAGSNYMEYRDPVQTLVIATPEHGFMGSMDLIFCDKEG